MAFDPKKMRSMGYGDGISLWLYTTDDNMAAVKDAAYFNAFSDQMSVNSVIIAAASDGTFLRQVSAVATGDVTTAGLTDIALITDNGGGTAGDTIGAFSGVYTVGEVRDAVATLAQRVNNILLRLGV